MVTTLYKDLNMGSIAFTLSGRKDYTVSSEPVETYQRFHCTKPPLYIVAPPDEMIEEQHSRPWSIFNILLLKNAAENGNVYFSVSSGVFFE
jgi:lipopolysaccharide export system protein LptC